ncbi:unnamed protein product, partial [Brassica oleracea]
RLDFLIGPVAAKKSTGVVRPALKNPTGSKSSGSSLEEEDDDDEVGDWGFVVRKHRRVEDVDPSGGEGSSCRELARAILKLGEVYERIEDKKDRSSKEEDDNELKTMLECVSVAFTTWSDSREIVTLNCGVDIQSAPRKLVETNPAAFSGPERTAAQDSKTVIDMDKHLHKIGGKVLLKKEAKDEHDGPGEPTVNPPNIFRRLVKETNPPHIKVGCETARKRWEPWSFIGLVKLTAK